MSLIRNHLARPRHQHRLPLRHDVGSCVLDQGLQMDLGDGVVVAFGTFAAMCQSTGIYCGEIASCFTCCGCMAGYWS